MAEFVTADPYVCEHGYPECVGCEDCADWADSLVEHWAQLEDAAAYRNSWTWPSGERRYV